MKEGEATKPQQGIFRFEHVNEDTSLFGDVIDPLFDPLGGERGKGQLTWGWRLSYSPAGTNPEWFRNARVYLPWLDQNANASLEYALEQYAFVPNKLYDYYGRPDLPYVGILAFNGRAGLKSRLEGRAQRVDDIGLTVGVAGSASGVNKSHDVFHSILGRKSSDWCQRRSKIGPKGGVKLGHLM